MIGDLFFVGVGVFLTMLVVSPLFRGDVIQTVGEVKDLVLGLFKKKA